MGRGAPSRGKRRLCRLPSPGAIARSILWILVGAGGPTWDSDTHLVFLPLGSAGEGSGELLVVSSI